MKKTLIIIFIILIFVLGFGIYLILNSDKHPCITAFINTNSDSNVAMVIKAENGEGLVAFTDENKVINKITIHTADGKSGVIQLNSSGLPTRLDFEGTVATFHNYTDTTVDITVKRVDGTSEVFEKSAISPKSLSFIPAALAYSVSEYMSGIGTTMNVVGCGVGLGSILFSGGSTTPLAYLGCASLTTRMLTIDTEIGSCKGDILDCAKDAILGSLIEEVQKHGPDFLKKGFRLKGNLKNSITGSQIVNGVIIVENKSTGKNLRGEWMPESYEIYLRDPGVYSSRLVSEGFADSKFDIILASKKAQIRIPNQPSAFEKDFGNEDYIEMEMDFFIDPDAFIRGEIIDSEEGESIKDAKILLFENATIVDEAMTESDGTFVVQPPLNETGKNFTLQISANEYKTQNIPIFISYDVVPKSIEYEIPNWNGVVKMEKGGQLFRFSFKNEGVKKCDVPNFVVNVPFNESDFKSRPECFDNKEGCICEGERCVTEIALTRATHKDGKIEFILHWGYWHAPMLRCSGEFDKYGGSGEFKDHNFRRWEAHQEPEKHLCYGTWTATPY